MGLTLFPGISGRARAIRLGIKDLMQGMQFLGNSDLPKSGAM
jgi:hypothetical protein